MVSISKHKDVKRSDLLLDKTDSVLFLVDIQERFRTAIPGFADVVKNAAILLQSANRLEIPVVFSEQYPKALGDTVPELIQYRLPDHRVFDKMCFSGAGKAEIVEHIRGLGRRQIVVAGVEAHVCVLQTAVDLMANMQVQSYVVADAMASRKDMDRKLALRRLDKGGVEVISAEMALFEWMEVAGTPEFKELQALVK